MSDMSGHLELVLYRSWNLQEIEGNSCRQAKKNMWGLSKIRVTYYIAPLELGLLALALARNGAHEGF